MSEKKKTSARRFFQFFRTFFIQDKIHSLLLTIGFPSQTESKTMCKLAAETLDSPTRPLYCMQKSKNLEFFLFCSGTKKVLFEAIFDVFDPIMYEEVKRVSSRI